ncbi:two component transcriptional regulator, LuxR family protein [Calothrix sp. NIES-4071]|nr:two component transcriptional regulator, LuxR family protein [Calothrix sp. NIES-4071]BAZ54800.1 two component transcriptional regulator, LuxR family protein [Calothrix sp. NIES-4105]
MSEQKSKSLSRLQLISLYVNALEQEDVQTANEIFDVIHLDERLKNIISEINIAYQEEDSMSAIPRSAGILTDKIRLAIIEGNYITRVGIRTTLSDHPEIEVIGEATSYLDGLILIQQQQPDVAIIDIDLPDRNGIELTRQLQQSNFAVKSIILAKYENTETVLSAFAAGADSYCLKEVEYNHLLEAIRVTHIGKKWIDPVVAGSVLETVQTRYQYLN